MPGTRNLTSRPHRIKFNQHFVDKLPMAESPVDYLRRCHDDLTYQDSRNVLGKFGLEGHAQHLHGGVPDCVLQLLLQR